jgi:signal transduction histidine kinase
MHRCLEYFDNLKIRSKLLVGYGLIILFLLAFAAAAAVWVKRIDDGSKAVLHEITPMVGVLRDLKFSGMQLMEAVKTAIIIQGIDAYTAEEDHDAALAAEAAAIDRERRNIADYLQRYDALPARHMALRELPRRDEILAKGRALLTAAEGFSTVLHTNSNSIRKLLLTDGQADVAYRAFAASVALALEDEAAELSEHDASVRSLIGNSLEFIVILTALAIAAALASAHVISNRIANPVLRLRDETTRVGEGAATTIELEAGRDEVGELTRAFAGMVFKLNESTQKRVGVLRQVASTVSHELRNPLAAIKTSVAVLRQADAKRGGEAASTFRRIERTIERCTRIILSLVDYTHLEDIDRKPVEIDMWATDWAARQTRPEGIAFSFEPASAVIVDVDPERLGQALDCLLENAVHALTGATWQVPAGHAPQIIVRTQSVGDTVMLSVADNGCGIPAENLPRIFEPLFTTKNFGVGLGLSMVKEIVEIHGGSVAVASAVNEGTTFTLTIPQRSAGEVILFDEEPEPQIRRPSRRLLSAAPATKCRRSAAACCRGARHPCSRATRRRRGRGS